MHAHEFLVIYRGAAERDTVARVPLSQVVTWAGTLSRRDHDRHGRGSVKQMDPGNWRIGMQFVSVNPMQRFGRADEVVGLGSYLLSDDSTFVNAAVIPSTAACRRCTEGARDEAARSRGASRAAYETGDRHARKPSAKVVIRPRGTAAAMARRSSAA